MNPITIQYYTTRNKRKNKRKIKRSIEKTRRLEKKQYDLHERRGDSGAIHKRIARAHGSFPLQLLLDNDQNEHKRTPSPATNDDPLPLSVLCNLKANANMNLQLDSVNQSQKQFKVGIQ